jgi:L-cysteine/cystine lyase
VSRRVIDVHRVRQLIPACQRVIYMNSGWSGPSPTRVVQAMKDRLDMENNEGPTTPHVLEMSRQTQKETRESVASLLNVSAEEITLTQSTTEGLNIVINGLTWQPGDEVITFAPEHSSVLVPCYYLGRRLGVIVNVLPLGPADSHEDIVERVAQAISSRTKLLFFSHIQYTSGLRMPAEALRKLAKENGIQIMMDGAQTPGHIALDLRALDCDFYSIPGHKWLLGPDGVGALYIRKELIPQVDPMKVAGRAIEADAQFQPMVGSDGHFVAKTGSMEKFEITTTSVPLWVGFMEAIRFHLDLGPSQVESRVLALAYQAKALLSSVPRLKILSPLDGPACSGLVSFTLDGWEPKALVEALWNDAKVVARSVHELPGVRISLSFFNTEEELYVLTDTLGNLSGKPPLPD